LDTGLPEEPNETIWCGQTPKLFRNASLADAQLTMVVPPLRLQVKNNIFELLADLAWSFSDMQLDSLFNRFERSKVNATGSVHSQPD
jgi:hypothetical protein